MINGAPSGASAGEHARFGAVIRSELFAMQFESDLRARRSASSLSGVQAGAVDVLRYRGLGEQWGERDESLIRSDHADYYVICAPTSAQLSVEQNGSSANLHQGSFAVVSTSLPFRARIRPESQSDFFSAVHVRMPGPLIRRHVPHIDEICGREIPARPGCSRMMLSLFELALTEGPHLSEAAKANVGRDLLDIFGHVAAALVEGTEPRGAKLSARERIVESARQFIALHLSDPDLDIQQIADYCGVSTRFLHASFRTTSEQTVAQLIRESRLWACQKALANPALQRRTIIQIAGDWGFDDPAHFCRLYKNRFGKTPREERRFVNQR